MGSAAESSQSGSAQLQALAPTAPPSASEQRAPLAMRRTNSHSMTPIPVPQNNGSGNMPRNATLGGAFTNSSIPVNRDAGFHPPPVADAAPPSAVGNSEPASARPRQGSLSASAPAFTPSSVAYSASAAAPPPPFVSNVFSFGHPPPVSPFGMPSPGQEYFAPAFVPPGFVPHCPPPRSVGLGGLPPVVEHGQEPGGYSPTASRAPTVAPPGGMPIPYHVSPPTPSRGFGMPVPDALRHHSSSGASMGKTPSPVMEHTRTMNADAGAPGLGSHAGAAALGSLAGLAMSRHAQNNSIAMPPHTPGLVPPSRVGYGHGHSPTVSINPSPKSQHRSPTGSISYSPFSGGSPVSNPSPGGSHAMPWTPGHLGAPAFTAPFTPTYPSQPSVAGVPPRFQPQGQHTRRLSATVPMASPTPPTSRGSRSPNGGTVASSVGRGRGGKIVHQPLKTTGHNSKPSVQMDPASFAFMLASQIGPTKEKTASPAPGDASQLEGDASISPSGSAQRPKKHVLVRLPHEVHFPDKGGGIHPFLPAELQEEAMALEAEVGDELDNDLADELESSYLDSDREDGDEEGGESEDPPSSSELDSSHSNSSSHRSLLITSSAVEREEKKVRLLSLRAIDHRRALWRARIPGPELGAAPPAPPRKADHSDLAQVFPWMDTQLQPISRLPHLEELAPTMLPDTLAVAMPLPPYRAWNGYVHWRLEERDRAEKEASQIQQAQHQQQLLQYQLSPDPASSAETNTQAADGHMAGVDQISVPENDGLEVDHQEVDIEARAADIDLPYPPSGSDGTKPFENLSVQRVVDESQGELPGDEAMDEGQEEELAEDALRKSEPEDESVPPKPTITFSPHKILQSPLPMPHLPDLDLEPGLLKGMPSDARENDLGGETLRSSLEDNRQDEPPSSRASLPWHLPGTEDTSSSPAKPSTALPQITVLHEGGRSRPSSRSSHSTRSRGLRAKHEPQYSLDLSSSGGPFGKEIFAALGLPSLSDFGGSDDEDARKRNFRSTTPYTSAPTPKLEHFSPPATERETKSDSAAPPPVGNPNAGRPASRNSSLDLPLSPGGPGPTHYQGSGQDLDELPTSNQAPSPMLQQVLEPESLLAQHVTPSNEDVPEELLTNPSDDADASEEDTSPYRPPHRLAGVPRLSAFGSLPLPRTLSPVLQPTVLEEYSDLEMEPSSPTDRLHHRSDEEFRALHEAEITHLRSTPTPPRLVHQRTLTCETLPSSSIGEGDRIMLDSPLVDTPSASRRTSLLPPGRPGSLSGRSSLPHMSGVGSSGDHTAISLHPPEDDIISNPSDEDDGYGTFGEEEGQDNGKAGASIEHYPMHHRTRLSFLDMTDPPWSSLHRGRPNQVPHMSLHPFLNQSIASSEDRSKHERSTSHSMWAPSTGTPEGSRERTGNARSASQGAKALNPAALAFRPVARFTASRPGNLPEDMSRATSGAPMHPTTDRTHHPDASLPLQDFEPPMAKPIRIRRPPNAGHQTGMTVANVLAHLRDMEGDVKPGRPPQGEPSVVPKAISKLEHVPVLRETGIEADSEPEQSPSAPDDSDKEPFLGTLAPDKTKLAPSDAPDLSLTLSTSPVGTDAVKMALVSSDSGHLSGARAWIPAARVASRTSAESDGMSETSNTTHGLDKSEEDVVVELARRLEASVDVWVDKLVREMHSAMSPAPVRWPGQRELPEENERLVELASNIPPTWTELGQTDKARTATSSAPGDKPQRHGDLHEQGELNFEIIQSILDRSLSKFKSALRTGVPDTVRPLLTKSAEEGMLVPKLSEDCLGRVATTIGFRLRGSLNTAITTIQAGLMGPPPEGSPLDLSVKRMERAIDSLESFASLQQSVEDAGMYVQSRTDRLVRLIQQGQDTFADELEMAVVRGITPQLEQLKEADLDPDLISGLLVNNVVQLVEEYSKYEDEVERTADLVSDLVRPIVSSLIQEFLLDVREQTESMLADWVAHANRQLEELGAQYRKTLSRTMPIAASGPNVKVVEQGVSTEEIQQAFKTTLEDYKADLKPATTLLEPLGNKQDKTNAELLQFMQTQAETLDAARVVPGLAKKMGDQLVAATLESKDAHGAILAKMKTLAAVDANMVARVSDLEEVKTVLEAKVEALHRELKERNLACHDAVAEVKAHRTYVESLEQETKSVRVRLAQTEESLLQAQEEVNIQRDRAMEAREAQNESRRELEKARLAQLAAEGRLQKLSDAHQDAKDRIQDSLAERDAARAALLAEREAHNAHAQAQQQRLEAAESAVTAARKQVDLLALRLLDVQSSADTRVTEQNMIAARALGEQAELRVRVAEQGEKLAELVDVLATQKDTLARKETQLSDACRRAADADKTTRMLRMAEATIRTLHERIEVAEASKSELQAAQESEKAARLELDEYRSHFDAMEQEVSQLKSTLIERVRLEQAEASKKENEELKRKIAELEAERAADADSSSLAPPGPSKVVRFAPGHTPVPSTPLMAPTTPNMPPTHRPHAQRPSHTSFDRPALGEKLHPVSVDQDGWWC